MHTLSDIPVHDKIDKVLVFSKLYVYDFWLAILYPTCDHKRLVSSMLGHGPVAIIL